MSTSVAELNYVVKTFRDAGLQARWGKTSAGGPIIFVRYPQAKAAHQREQWWACDNYMFESMKKRGIVAGFDSCTLLGDIFSLKA